MNVTNRTLLARSRHAGRIGLSRLDEPMNVTLLGTGSPIPNPDRAGPATLVRTSSATLLFDCGRGVVMRLAKAGLVPSLLSGVVLTHLHSDHVCDLNDIITTHWVMNAQPTPLQIVGPVGTKDFVAATLEAMTIDIGYRRNHHNDLQHAPMVEVTEANPGDVISIAGQELRCDASDHRPVEPSLAYRIDDEGTSVVIAGDGVPCASLDALLLGANVYVQTVIRDDLVRQIPNVRLQDILDYHSTVSQAGDTAQRAGVDMLVLTHMVPPPAPNSGDEWRALASAFDGVVVLADDLTSIDLATMEVVSAS